MVKPVDMLHGTVNRWRGRAHCGAKVTWTLGAASLHRRETHERSGSPVLVGKAELEASSPEREWQWRGGTTVVEDGGGKFTSHGY
jgi:hypothetical protein